MSKVSYVHRFAIGILVTRHGSVRNPGGGLRLAGVREQVRNVFEMASIGKVPALDPTVVDAAVAATGNP